MTASATDLTSLILHGDAGWDQIVAECEPRIAAWCRRAGLQNADAADVSQNVLLKMLLALRSGSIDEGRGHLLCWLKVVTHNTLCSFLWKRKVTREYGFGEDHVSRRDFAQEPTDFSVHGTETVDSDECFLNAQLRQAESCVKPRVKPQTWEAYRLTMHENLSPRRTAEQIGVSVREVYVAKCRVIGYVRRELGFENVPNRARASRS